MGRRPNSQGIVSVVVWQCKARPTSLGRRDVTGFGPTQSRRRIRNPATLAAISSDRAEKKWRCPSEW
jgi:hypothetical protein